MVRRPLNRTSYDYPDFSGVVQQLGYIPGTGSGGGGSNVWSDLTNATANLTLNNAAYTTTFNQTSPVAWKWANTSGINPSIEYESKFSSLTGWNQHRSDLCIIDSTFGNPAPSFYPSNTGSANGSINLDTGITNWANKVMQFDFSLDANTSVYSYAEFQFGCDWNGAGGVIVRVSSFPVTNPQAGILSSVGWDYASGWLSTAITLVTFLDNSWHTIRVVVDATATHLDWYMDGTIVQANVPITITGGGFVGFGSDYHTSGNSAHFDNFFIGLPTGGSANSPVLELAGSFQGGFGGEEENYGWQVEPTSGANGPSSLVLSHAGTEGVTSVDMTAVNRVIANLFQGSATELTDICGYGPGGSRPAASSGNVGQIYYNTTNSELERSNGTTWDSIASAGGGGSGGSGWTFFDPDLPPLVPDSHNDEFTGTSLDPKWTRVNSGVVWTSFDVGLTTLGMLTVNSSTGNGQTLEAILQVLPDGDFSIYVKSYVQLTNTGQQFFSGIILSSTNAAGSGRQLVLGNSSNNGNTYLQGYQWSNFDSYGGGGTPPGISTTPEMIAAYATYRYLRMRRSGTTYYGAGSMDGSTWIEWTLPTPAATPAYFGMMNHNNSANHYWDKKEFFRYFDTANASLGGMRTVGSGIGQPPIWPYRYVFNAISPYTVNLATDSMFNVDCSGGDVVINLPAPTSSSWGQVFTFIREDNYLHTCTINAAGIDNATSYVLPTWDGVVGHVMPFLVLQAMAGQYYIIGSSQGSGGSASWPVSGTPTIIATLGALSNSSGVLTNNGSGTLSWGAGGAVGFGGINCGDSGSAAASGGFNCGGSV